MKGKIKGEKIKDDKTMIMEYMIQLVAKLPHGSRLRESMTNNLIKELWDSLDHPPLIYVGDKFRYREADGSNNVSEESWGIEWNDTCLQPEEPNVPDARCGWLHLREVRPAEAARTGRVSRPWTGIRLDLCPRGVHQAPQQCLECAVSLKPRLSRINAPPESLALMLTYANSWYWATIIIHG